MNKVIFIIAAILALTFVVSGINGCPKEEAKEEELKCISPIFEEGEAAEEFVLHYANTGLTFYSGGGVHFQSGTFNEDTIVKWKEKTNFINMPKNLTLLSTFYNFVLPKNISLNKWITLLMPYNEKQDKGYTGIYCYVGDSKWQYVKTLKTTKEVAVARIKTDGTFAVFKSDQPLPKFAKVELRDISLTVDPQYPQRGKGYKFSWKDPISDGWDYWILVSKDASFNESSIIFSAFTSLDYFFTLSTYKFEKGKSYYWKVNRILPDYSRTNEWSEVKTFRL